MFALPLLATKLYSPPARPGLVARSHLTDILNEGRRLTLISAPPGFGKTTLVTAWYAKVKHGMAMAWLSLDEADNDPVRFLTYLLGSFDTYLPDTGKNALGLLQSPASAASSLDSVLTIFVNDLFRVSHAPGVLVLDDYHVIQSPGVHQAVTFLVENLPPQWRMILTTRTDPPLPLARWRVRGQLDEIRAADLRFASNEVALFLNQVMGLGLRIEDIAALETRTEGWIAGLQLAALSLKEHRDRSRFVAAFSGSHRYVADYLLEEVLARQSEVVREFMLHTSLLDRLCGPLCDALVGGDHGWTTLEALERANLFLIPLDNERHWYRYHHLFGEVLRMRLQQTQPETVALLHQRASQWFEQNNLFDEAVSHALAGSDFERAAWLVEQVFQGSLQNGTILNLWRWLSALPKEYLRRRPHLCLAYAWTLSAWTSAGDQSRSWGEIESWIQAAGSAVGAERLVIRANLASIREDFSSALALSQEALAVLSPESPWRALMTMFLGESHLMVGDANLALEWLTNANNLSLEARSNDFWLLTTTHLADVNAAHGDLGEAERLYRQVIEHVNGAQHPQRRAIMAHGGLASVLYETNHLDEAHEYLKRGLNWLEQVGGSLRSMIVNYIPLARVQQAQGQEAEALATLRYLETVARREKVHALTVGWIAAWGARLQLAQGDLAAVARWVSISDLPLEADLPTLIAREWEYRVLARFFLLQDDLEAGLGLLGRLIQMSLSSGRRGNLPELYSLQALGYQRQGDDGASLVSLGCALDLAASRGYARTFLDEGEALQRLLSGWRSQVQPGVSLQTLHYAGQILSAFNLPTDSPALMQSDTLISPLSEREVEVLHLLASGHSNQAIAQALFLTVNTVKRHISHIFDKLDVNSRTQAVARAREIKLL